MDDLVEPAPDVGDPASSAVARSFEDRYGSLLDHAYCVGVRFFGPDRHMAQEVAQETLTRAYESWGRVCRHPSPEAWVMNAAWKVSLELERKRGRNLPYHVVVQDSGWAEDRIVSHPLLTSALRKLTKRQRTVVMARHYFGYDVRQSAALLGMSESQVKSATNEATTRLRRLLKDDVEVTA